MDEKKIYKLKVLDKPDIETEVKEKIVKPHIQHPNHTNPILKKLAVFHNEKIGDKWSIKDLLR